MLPITLRNYLPVTWQNYAGLTPTTSQTFDQTLDALENQISEASAVVWFNRSVSLLASAGVMNFSRPFVGDAAAVAISSATFAATRAFTERLLIQPKLKRLREEYHKLSDQLERRQQAHSASSQELRNMVGLDGLKAYAEKLHKKIKVQKMRKDIGLECDDLSSGHMLFTGNPGTGKTISAQLLTHILYELGVIKENKIVKADRSELVGEYIGSTAIKTKELVHSAKNGVLFIDEAYSLFQGNSDKDFGSEAIEQLLIMLEEPDTNTVVIMAGYPKQMEQLIDSNPGFRSRISVKIHFDDYTDEQLINIFRLMCEKKGYVLTEDAFNICKEKLPDIKKREGDRFANARSVRNFFESVKSAQECRLVNEYAERFDDSNGARPEDPLTPQDTNPASPNVDVVQQLKELTASDIETAATDQQYQSKPHEPEAWKDIYG